MNEQIYMLQKVAAVLAAVPQTVVFTGGATISLYLDDVSAPDIRPTDDVDCVLTLLSLKTRGFLLHRDSNEFTLSKHLHRLPNGCESSNENYLSGGNISISCIATI